MRACSCRKKHAPNRVVVTGGPGAGKTAVLELVRHHFCAHVRVLPEAAGILYGGGFPRLPDDAHRRAGQRLIFDIQRELEILQEGANAALVLCDRGTLDGLAYWPGQPTDLLEAMGTTHAEQLARYQAVIHLRTPRAADGYDHANRLRIESAPEAAAIDEKILRIWQEHPRRHVVESRANFIEKAQEVMALILGELPVCCRPGRPSGRGSAPR